VRNGAALSKPVFLANMFNPQVFLNSLRQQTSRTSEPPVAIDDLRLVCVWGEAASRSMGTLPCALSGLSLQGALFTAGGTLSDARADTPTVTTPSTAIRAAFLSLPVQCMPTLSGWHDRVTLCESAILSLSMLARLALTPACHYRVRFAPRHATYPRSWRQVVPLPTCIIAFIPKHLDDPQPDAGSVVLPVYEGLDRSKLLAKLRMPCKNSEQSRWIMAGTAIFVSAE